MSVIGGAIGTAPFVIPDWIRSYLQNKEKNQVEGQIMKEVKTLQDLVLEKFSSGNLPENGFLITSDVMVDIPGAHHFNPNLV